MNRELAYLQPDLAYLLLLQGGLVTAGGARDDGAVAGGFVVPGDGVTLVGALVLVGLDVVEVEVELEAVLAVPVGVVNVAA